MPCVICGKPSEIHHIVFRSQGGLLIPLNEIELCPNHHRLGHDSPHKNRLVDLNLKKNLQAKLYQLFYAPYYTSSHIQRITGMTNNQVTKFIKTLPVCSEGYAREDIIRKLMGGRIY